MKSSLETTFSLDKKSEFTIWVIICIFWIYQTGILSFSPLPWFDEVYFASITDAFLNGEGFLPKVAATMQHQETTAAYGPIYFWLIAFSVKVFGFNPFGIRIIALLAGILSVLLSYKLLSKHSSKAIALFGVALLSFDPFWNVCLKQGRMDMLCVAFILGGLLLISDKKNHRELTYLIGSSSLFGLSILTNPRSGIILIPVFVFLLWQLAVIHKNPKLVLGFLIPSVVLYFLWIIVGFGGFNEWYSFYSGLLAGGDTTAVHGYLGGRGYIPKHEWLLIITAIFCAVTKLIAAGQKAFNWFDLTILSYLLCYYILVLDWGPYSVYVIPLFYVIIIKTIHGTSLKPLWILAPLALFNVAFVGLKTLYEISSLQARKTTHIESFINSHIPKGSKVIGSDSFYYVNRNAGNEYELSNRCGTLQQRSEALMNQFDYDYLIIGTNETILQPEVSDYFLKMHSLNRVARFEDNPSSFSNFLISIPFFDSIEKHGYACTLYQRVKD